MSAHVSARGGARLTYHLGVGVRALLFGLTLTGTVWVLLSLGGGPTETVQDANTAALKWATQHRLVGPLECHRPPGTTQTSAEYYQCTLRGHLEDLPVTAWCRRGGCVEETP